MTSILLSGYQWWHGEPLTTTQKTLYFSTLLLDTGGSITTFVCGILQTGSLSPGAAFAMVVVGGGLCIATSCVAITRRDVVAHSSFRDQYLTLKTQEQ